MGKKSFNYMQELNFKKKMVWIKYETHFFGFGANLCRPVKAGEKVLNPVALKQKPYVYLLCYLFISGRVHYK